MITYRVAPTVAVVVVFFIVANGALMLILGGPKPQGGEPDHEAWLVYYALRYADELPESIDEASLRSLLAALDPDAPAVLRRFEIVSFTREGKKYELKLRHENGKVFRLTRGGVTGV